MIRLLCSGYVTRLITNVISKFGSSLKIYVVVSYARFGIHPYLGS